MKRTTHMLLIMVGAGALAACRDNGTNPEITGAVSATATPVQVTRSFEMPVRAAVTTAVTDATIRPDPTSPSRAASRLAG